MCVAVFISLVALILCIMLDVVPPAHVVAIVVHDYYCDYVCMFSCCVVVLLMHYNDKTLIDYFSMCLY